MFLRIWFRVFTACIPAGLGVIILNMGGQIAEQQTDTELIFPNYPLRSATFLFLLARTSTDAGSVADVLNSLHNRSYTCLYLLNNTGFHPLRSFFKYRKQISKEKYACETTMRQSSPDCVAFTKLRNEQRQQNKTGIDLTHQSRFDSCYVNLSNICCVNLYTISSALLCHIHRLICQT